MIAGVELLSQVVNVHLDGITFERAVPFVETSFQLLPGEHPPCVGHELVEDGKFPHRQLDLAAIERHPVRGRIQHQRSNRQYRRRVANGSTR